MDWFCHSMWDTLEITKLNRPNAGEVRVLIPGPWALGELPTVFTRRLAFESPTSTFLEPQRAGLWHMGRGLLFRERKTWE